MRSFAVWLAISLLCALPAQAREKERWMAGYNAGGVYSEVDGSGGTFLSIYCNIWVDAHPAGLLITLPATVTSADDKFYDIIFFFSDGEMSFTMLLTQGRALQFSAKGDEKFSDLEELAARIKASDGFSAASQELAWSENFSSNNAGPGIGSLLDCTAPDLD